MNEHEMCTQDMKKVVTLVYELGDGEANSVGHILWTHVGAGSDKVSKKDRLYFYFPRRSVRSCK